MANGLCLFLGTKSLLIVTAAEMQWKVVSLTMPLINEENWHLTKPTYSILPRDSEVICCHTTVSCISNCLTHCYWLFSFKKCPPFSLPKETTAMHTGLRGLPKLSLNCAFKMFRRKIAPQSNPRLRHYQNMLTKNYDPLCFLNWLLPLCKLKFMVMLSINNTLQRTNWCSY